MKPSRANSPGAGNYSATEASNISRPATGDRNLELALRELRRDGCVVVVRHCFQITGVPHSLASALGMPDGTAFWPGKAPAENDIRLFGGHPSEVRAPLFGMIPPLC